MRQRTSWMAYNEHGTVLVIGMLTLVMLTLIGVAATRTSSVESEMSGNEKTHQEAFYAAEAALITSETVIRSFRNQVDVRACAQGLFSNTKLVFDQTTNRIMKTPTTGTPKTLDLPTESCPVAQLPTGLQQAKANPRYAMGVTFIPAKNDQGTQYGQRVDAHVDVAALGTGSNKAAQAVLQTLFIQSLQ